MATARFDIRPEDSAEALPDNAWVADETIEDDALCYTPRSFRKWSALRVSNTALGATSLLALEPIGASIAVDIVRHGATASG